MKLTLQNACLKFEGTNIDILNLVAGRERYRVQHAPIVGAILWDDDNKIEVANPFESKPDDLLQVSFSWVGGVENTPFRACLDRIYIGTKYTGPILCIELGRLNKPPVYHPLFSNGDFGKNCSSGGTWMQLGAVTMLSKDVGYVAPKPATLFEAMTWRFEPALLRVGNRHYTESPALVTDIVSKMSELLG